MLLSLCTIKIFARKKKSDAGNGKCPSLRHFFHSSFAHQAFSPTIRSNSSPVIVSWASRYSATAVSTSRRAVKISSQRYARGR